MMKKPEDHVTEIFKRIKYKPRSKIYTITSDPMYENPRSVVMFRVSHPVIDVNPPHEEIEVIVNGELELDHLHDEQYVIAKVYEAIKTLQLHEIDEWLRFDGHRLTEPH